MYPTLADIKACLWITTTTNDVQLQCAIDQAIAVIEREIWCNICANDASWNPITHTQMIDICEVSTSYRWTSCYHEFLLCVPEVDSIVSLNGTAYTWANGATYRIKKPNNRKIVISDLLNYVDHCPEFWCFEIEYLGWYTTFPEDLKLAIAWKAFAEWCKDATGQIIKELKLGDKTVKYAIGEETVWASSDLFTFENALKKYKKAMNLNSFTCL